MLQHLLAVCVLAAGGTDVVCHGPVPRDYIRQHESQRVQPTRLTHEGPDYLLMENDTSLAVFRIADSELRRVGVVPLPALPNEWAVARRWLERDMDGDSLPEFLVAHGSELWEFKWRDSAFALVSTVGLPGEKSWIEDFVFGDINRDGRTELIVVAGDHKPDSAESFLDSTTLYVTRWRTDSLHVLWTDSGRLGFDCASSVGPPDDLVGVYDIGNTGYEELIYERVESSVAPFTYDCFIWKETGLFHSRHLALDDIVFAQTVPESERLRKALLMDPFIENGRTKLYLVGFSYDSTGEDRTWKQVVVLQGDTVTDAKTVSTYMRDSDYEEAHCELDPDGKGKGVLRLISNSIGGLWFEFRR